MAIWPFYVAILASMIFWGYRVGAWVAPALVLAGLIGMRAVAVFFDPALHAVAACTLWLCIAMVMAYKGAIVPAFFLCLSGLSYGAFWLLGVGFERFSIMLISADIFGLLALLVIGGGLWAATGHHRRSGAGLRDRFACVALGMASREARGFVAVESGSKMIYGKN
jgi:hypothetical protein